MKKNLKYLLFYLNSLLENNSHIFYSQDLQLTRRQYIVNLTGANSLKKKFGD